MLLVRNQRTPEWKQAHIGRITSSTAAACLGLSPWTSRQAAYRSVRGEEKERTNRHLEWGIEFEAKARTAYEAETGFLVEETGFWVHDEIDWLGASPDGLVNGCGMVELKCPSRLPDSIPAHYEIQMRVQMYVCNRQWCDFFAWNQSGHFLARLARDEEEEARLVGRLDEFRRDFLLTNTVPPRKKAVRKAVAI